MVTRRTFFGISAASVGGFFFGSIPSSPPPVSKMCFGIVNVKGQIVHRVPIVSITKAKNGWNYKALDFHPTQADTIRGITIFDHQGRTVKSCNFSADVPVCNGDILKTNYSLSVDKPGKSPNELLEALRLREQHDSISRQNLHSRSNHPAR